MTETLNLYWAATHMLDEFRKKGLNGIRFVRCTMQGQHEQDWLDDGYTKEDYKSWRHNYASFILQPDLPVLESPNQYTAVEFDRESFEKDLERQLVKHLGDDVNIKFNQGCYEYEVTRTMH